MRMISKKFGKTLMVAALSAGLVAGGFGLTRRVGAPDDLAISRVDFSAVTDLSDDRKLVGLADSVFFGEVLAKAGSVDGELLETQFAVKVQEVLKGSLPPVVVVNQQGGYADGTLVLMDGDMLLEPGRSYLFVTRTYEAKGWHTLVPGFGDISVQSAKLRDELRSRFTAARDRQIPFSPTD